MINTLSFIPRENPQNAEVQKIHEIGFLVALLLIIVTSFLFFYFAVPGFAGLVSGLGN